MLFCIFCIYYTLLNKLFCPHLSFPQLFSLSWKSGANAIEGAQNILSCVANTMRLVQKGLKAQRVVSYVSLKHFWNIAKCFSLLAFPIIQSTTLLCSFDSLYLLLHMILKTVSNCSNSSFTKVEEVLEQKSYLSSTHQNIFAYSLTCQASMSA